MDPRPKNADDDKVFAFTIALETQLLIAGELAQIHERSLKIEKSMGVDAALDYCQERLLAWSKLVALLPTTSTKI
jgi:hypothetical protein